jgi:hypothetical protein
VPLHAWGCGNGVVGIWMNQGLRRIVDKVRGTARVRWRRRKNDNHQIEGESNAAEVVPTRGSWALHFR